VRVTPQCDTLGSLTIHADPYIQWDPTVAFCGENFVVAWSDGRFAQSHYYIAAAAVDTAGNVIDTSKCIGAQVMADEYWPDVAFDGTRCLVVWYNNDQPFGVYGRFVDGMGQPQGSVVNIAMAAAGYNVNPSITYMPDQYLVVWADKRPGQSDLDICAQLVSTTGSLIGEKLSIATGPANQMYPQVCNNGMQYLVVWREAASAIHGRWLNPDGGFVGETFQISDSTSFYRFRAGIDASATGFMAAWSEARNDERDIYGSTGTMTGHVGGSQGFAGSPVGPTLIRGPLSSVVGPGVRIFDACGREIRNRHVPCGVYYVESDKRIVHKIVKVE
jgi:hypothetical protein